MIGREEEFSQAVSLWQKTAAGQGQFLLISGEPGIGKTRMVRELSTYTEISGGKTLTGLCYAEERTPYSPIAQMVETSLEDRYKLNLPQPVMADLLTLAPELRLNYPDVPPNDRLDPEAEQQRLFESIITWFGALTKHGNLLMVIDDVHWADSGSLTLLRHLARRISRRRALVVATYREVELDEALPL
jgi:predicted ATPase